MGVAVIARTCGLAPFLASDWRCSTPKSMLLVDDRQPQFGEFVALLNQRVRPDGNARLTAGDPFAYGRPLLLRLAAKG